jgi:hypothetical protein
MKLLKSRLSQKLVIPLSLVLCGSWMLATGRYEAPYMLTGTDFAGVTGGACYGSDQKNCPNNNGCAGLPCDAQTGICQTASAPHKTRVSYNWVKTVIPPGAGNGSIEQEPEFCCQVKSCRSNPCVAIPPGGPLACVNGSVVDMNPSSCRVEPKGPNGSSCGG